jgi:hypothetical protein
MNNKQRKTLSRLFESPTRSDIKWSDVVSLFKALGCEMFEGSGSRVTFVFQNGKIDMHKPHPQKELKKYAVENIRIFFEANDIIQDEQ